MRILRLSRLRELVEEVTGVSASLVSFSVITEDDSTVSGWVVVSSAVYSRKRKELSIEFDDDVAKMKLLKNVLCLIPQTRVYQAEGIKHGYIIVSDLDTGFLRIQGKSLLSRDSVVGKYSEMLPNETTD